MSVDVDFNRLTRPVEGPDPSGPDLVHEPIYRQLDRAREPDPGEQGRPRDPDWKGVVRLGLDTLYDRSKDLQVAAYVTEALGWLEGLHGLRKGFDLILALQEAFWEAAHPAPQDGDLEPRIVPYEFLDEVLPRLLHVGIPLTRTPGSEPYNLQRFLRARGVEEIEARDDAVRRTEVRFHADLAAGLDGLRSSFESWAAATSARLGDRSPPMRRVAELVAEMANCLVTIDHVRPFPRDEGPRPDAEVKAAVVDDDDHDDATGPVIDSGDATPARPSPLARSSFIELNDDRGAATVAAELLASGKLIEAVEVLDHARQSARCRRDRFFRQLELVELFVRAGSYPVARPLLDELSEDLESYRLAAWEDPSVIARLLVALLAAYRASKSEEDHALIPDVLARLCRFDPGRALGQQRPES